MSLPFRAALALADCCARILSEHPPIGVETWQGERQARARLIREAVQGLRFLWSTGDACQRSTVAARVRVWLRKDGDAERFMKRESARLGI